MSRAEREQFLAEPHVGVLSVLEDGAPLTIPIWYGYLAGGPVSVITGRDSRKARAVQTGGCQPVRAGRGVAVQVRNGIRTCLSSARRAMPISVPWPLGTWRQVPTSTCLSPEAYLSVGSGWRRPHTPQQ